MSNKYEPPTTGNWLTWDLYSEKPLTDDQLTESLNYFRDELKAYIYREGHKDYLYLLDLQFYKDKGNNKFYRVAGNLAYMPKKGLTAKGFDFDHDFAVFSTIGDAAGGATGPVRPVGPKGWVEEKTPFLPIMSEPIVSRNLGALIHIH